MSTTGHQNQSNKATTKATKSGESVATSITCREVDEPKRTSQKEIGRATIRLVTIKIDTLKSYTHYQYF